mmetsp:Transcript_10852/g.23450  ORF Transcript_10852/g.23450 Transcript_10852/m.23450 type:complete len:751 (+) Transcript_10852:136-2388(+)
MRIQIYGCRGSIPRPNPEMARYGGNTPCIEVVSAKGHRIILDLGSGAYDLGNKVLGELFTNEKKADQEKKIRRDEAAYSESAIKEDEERKVGGSILLTHTHWDHIQGLPFFVPLYLPQFEWTIYGPRGVAKSLQEILSGQMQHDYFPVRLGDMGSTTKYVGLSEDTEGGVWLGGRKNGSHEGIRTKSNDTSRNPSTLFRVTTKYLNHTVLTLGYKLEEFVEIPPDPLSRSKNVRKKRISMAYITDHEPYDHSLAGGGFVSHNFNPDCMKNPLINPLSAEPVDQVSKSIDSPFPTADQSHAKFIADVDVLIHDCQYYFSEYSQESVPKESWGHSTVEYVVDVAFFSNVRRLILFHHDPQRTDLQMDSLVGFARERARVLEERFFGEGSNNDRIRMKIDAAMEGDVYELDPMTLGWDVQGEYQDVVEDTMEEEHITEGGSQEKKTVLLGFFETGAETIYEMLKSSNHIEVKLLQSSNDILQYAKEKKPSVVVLDQYVFGCSGLDICREIREMGEWGYQVPLLVVASSARTGDARNDEFLTSQELHVEDYIREPYSPAYLFTRIQMSMLRIPLRWRRAPIPKCEAKRLEALQNTHLLDSDPEERFDRITRLAKTMFHVPIALVSMVDKQRQWFKSTCGLDTKETPRDHAFCAHAILQNDLLVVPDALQDDRFADNPLVSGGPKIRFYAACPIRVPSDGDERMAIGTMCIIDSKPRDLREEERRALVDFGAMVEKEIADELQRKTRKDGRELSN